jgi:hypothetical protein
MKRRVSYNSICIWQWHQKSVGPSLPALVIAEGRIDVHGADGAITASWLISETTFVVYLALGAVVRFSPRLRIERALCITPRQYVSQEA